MTHDPLAAAPRIAAAGPHPPLRQLDALTSLRFFAAMMVLAFHYASVGSGDAPFDGPASLGYSGVTFFFMLSGFILAYNYRDADFADPAIRRRYFLARLARIVPVYLLSLLLALPFFWRVLIDMPPSVLRNLFAAGAVLAPLGLQSWVPGAACALNCPSWSISTELFFYLLFPFAFPLVYRRPWHWGLSALLILIILWTLGGWLWAQLGGGRSIMQDLGPAPGATIAAQLLKYFPPIRVPEFLLGIVLFVFWERAGSRLAGAGLLAACAMAVAALWLLRNQVPELALHDGLTAIAWAPLILFGATVHGGPLAAPALIFLGRISFSLYLTHVTVLSLMNSLDRHVLGGALRTASPWLLVLPSALAALLVAALVYRLVEDPARRLIVRWTGSRPPRAPDPRPVA
jgi:peptidoglycan/LPS O-acetylase OafA/YrhL